MRSLGGDARAAAAVRALLLWALRPPAVLAFCCLVRGRLQGFLTTSRCAGLGAGAGAAGGGTLNCSQGHLQLTPGAQHAAQPSWACSMHVASAGQLARCQQTATAPCWVNGHLMAASRAANDRHGGSPRRALSHLRTQ